MTLDKGLQFIARLIKKLNKILRIETKLLIVFHLQTDKQVERMNQELEQYLRMYINYRQENWSEQLAAVEFVFNNKVYISTKSLPFKFNYGRKPTISFKIRKKRKYTKIEKFVKKMIEKKQQSIKWEVECC